MDKVSHTIERINPIILSKLEDISIIELTPLDEYIESILKDHVQDYTGEIIEL